MKKRRGGISKERRGGRCKGVPEGFVITVNQAIMEVVYNVFEREDRYEPWCTLSQLSTL